MSSDLNHIELSDYHYVLPQERIAQHPLKKRDESKLLHYNKGKISHHCFFELPELLNQQGLLVFNNTKVIPARVWFKRKTGAIIEVFLLEPTLPSKVMEEAMLAQNTCTWKCMIGNLKKWKDEEVLGCLTTLGEVKAVLHDRSQQEVRLFWDGSSSFGDVLLEIGAIPLPPYIKRQAGKSDQEDYQTVYARKHGAVAAPTAGLHFSESVLADLQQRNIKQAPVTLHVGAGTFAPVTAEKALDHNMHKEHFAVSREAIEMIIANSDRTLVGTTTLRTMESLYWMGLKCIKNIENPHILDKLEAYKLASHYAQELPSYEESLKAILERLDAQNLNEWKAETAIMIMPGYLFKSTNKLITNFHLPGTTLMLLVGAFIGEDWKLVYEQALSNEYRFLSYGDSSLLERA